jgi:hypothetical protein
MRSNKILKKFIKYQTRERRCLGQSQEIERICSVMSVTSKESTTGNDDNMVTHSHTLHTDPNIKQGVFTLKNA